MDPRHPPYPRETTTPDESIEEHDPWGDTLDELAPHRGVIVSSKNPEKSKKMVRNARRRYKQGRITLEQLREVEDRSERVALEEIGHQAFKDGLLDKLVKK